MAERAPEPMPERVPEPVSERSRATVAEPVPTPAAAAPDLPPDGFSRARRLFRRGLALVVLVAIGSLWVQIDGLAGSRGIQPAAESQAAFEASPFGGDWRWRPTLLWFDGSDAMLHGLCAAGVLLALLMLCDVAPALCALLLWAVYLSLCWACGVFLQFQWDSLLVETLLLAALWLPWRLRRERRTAPDEPVRVGRWLLGFLLFRFMFESGVVKLTYGDPTWRDLSAMTFHHMTQPLPHVLGWFAHHLPRWVHQVSTAGTLVIELLLPWCLLAPRRLRHAAALSFVLLQLLIGASGNYGFFGLLTSLLCLPQLDDRLLRWRRPAAATPGASPGAAVDATPGGAPAASWGVRVQRAVAAVCAVPILLLGGRQLVDSCQPPDSLYGMRAVQLTREQVQAGVLATLRDDGLRPALELLALRAEPFLSVNAYGLFRVMTTTRPGMRVQLSADGQTWVDCDFRWQVDRLDEAPGFVQPHMPRLDWQLWFEALRWEPQALSRRVVSASPWFLRFMQRLLDAEPAVLGLLARDPLDGRPPQAVRACVVEHAFSTPAEREASGAWWVEQPLMPAWITWER